MLDITNAIDDSATSKQFNISLNSYEGPIDLLLDLAKKQKQAMLKDLRSVNRIVQKRKKKREL